MRANLLPVPCLLVCSLTAISPPARAVNARTTTTAETAYTRQLPASPSPGPEVGPEPFRQASSSRLPSRLERRLGEAFDLALGHLGLHPECQELFEHLELDATDSLGRSLYVPASVRHEQILCRQGVSAFTVVGGRVTFLCRSFGRLAAPRAAMTLIHEALHHAGLSESPRDPEAPASAEINETVASSCRL